MLRNRILVTGGAGFIGSHLAAWLLMQGHHVTILDDFSGGFKSNLPQLKGMTYVEGSVTDAEMLDKLFKTHKFEYVFHLAAYAAEGLSHFIRRFNYTNNLIGTTNIVNACVNHGVKHLTFASSIAVYGDGLDGAVAFENSPTHPVDPYGIAKLAAEQDIQAAGLYFGLNYTIFRLHNVYGPNQNIGDPYRNVIGIFMNQLMQGNMMPVIGDGSQLRAFTYVEDIMYALANGCRTPEMWGEVFNLGSETLTSIRDLAGHVARAMGKQARITYVSNRPESHGLLLSHKKLSNIIKFRNTPLEIGLTKMAQWAKREGPRHGQRFDDIEIREPLPEFWRNVSSEETHNV